MTQFYPKDLSELDELTEEHLGFSALSEGLGFAKQAKRAAEKPSQPFEPSEKDAELQRKALSGAGAVAAGPARPATAETLASLGFSQTPSVSSRPAASSAPRAVPAPTANEIGRAHV